MNRVFGTSPNFPVVIPGESWGLPLDRAAHGLRSRRKSLAIRPQWSGRAARVFV